MKRITTIIHYAFIICLFPIFLPISLHAQGIFKLTWEDVEKHKAYYDDPRPLFKDLPIIEVLPPDVYATLVYDEEDMKSLWADVVGFKTPDVVGKIGSEITPGVYSYLDKEKLPFEELMIPNHYERFKPGEPPFTGNYSTINIVPTQQYYWALPLATATKDNRGKAQLDDQGYLQYETYASGFPFPKPEGTFKAEQIMYNWEKRYVNSDSAYLFEEVRGFNKDLKEDFHSIMDMITVKLEGRVIMEPLGCFDEQARKNNESRINFNTVYSPRDMYGSCFAMLSYADADKMDQPLMYLPQMRKIRKSSGTDTQDPMSGQDIIFEDGDGFSQKLSPYRYPYRYELIAEREYLVPSFTTDGFGYFSSKTKELVDLDFERRMVYVLQLTQLDENFVYSKRIMYFDKETFLLLYVENYDQKGRLYRDNSIRYYFCPEMGMFFQANDYARDMVEQHSTRLRIYPVPAPHITRQDINLRDMIRSR